LNLNKGQAFMLFIRNYLVRPIFASGCFERITFPVVLITHNGDEDLPSDENAPKLDHPYLIHWFALNCDRVHEKLACILSGMKTGKGVLHQTKELTELCLNYFLE